MTTLDLLPVGCGGKFLTASQWAILSKVTWQPFASLLVMHFAISDLRLRDCQAKLSTRFGIDAFSFLDYEVVFGQERSFSQCMSPFFLVVTDSPLPKARQFSQRDSTTIAVLPLMSPTCYCSSVISDLWRESITFLDCVTECLCRCSSDAPCFCFQDSPSV
jgi:hypothetical protein